MGSIVAIGNNADVVWTFGAMVLGIYLVLAILVMGVEAVRRFTNDA